MATLSAFSGFCASAGMARAPLSMNAGPAIARAVAASSPRRRPATGERTERSCRHLGCFLRASCSRLARGFSCTRANRGAPPAEISKAGSARTPTNYAFSSSCPGVRSSAFNERGTHREQFFFFLRRSSRQAPCARPRRRRISIAGKPSASSSATRQAPTFDTYLRALSRHMSKHIPGRPVMVIRTCPAPAA